MWTPIPVALTCRLPGPRPMRPGTSCGKSAKCGIVREIMNGGRCAAGKKVSVTNEQVLFRCHRRPFRRREKHAWPRLLAEALGFVYVDTGAIYRTDGMCTLP